MLERAALEANPSGVISAALAATVLQPRFPVRKIPLAKRERQPYSLSRPVRRGPMRATIVAASLAIALLLAPPAWPACGLLGCVIQAIPVPGAKQLGQGLDNTNRQLKQALPPYGQTEDAISGGVQHGLNELNGETAGPALAAWINASRSDVINAGVGPIPQDIYEGLVGFFPPELLQSVRYRSGWGNEVALPAMVFRFGDREAITLGSDVIMFKDEDVAQTNLSIWAHELTHVLQYRRWGVLDFAKRYVKDWNGVEQEAINNASRFDAWYQNRESANQTTMGNAPSVSESQGAVGNICRTPFGLCILPGTGPIGMGCYCGTPRGPVTGNVSAN